MAGISATFLSGGQALAVAGASEVPDGGLPFVAKVSFGDRSACTGALVDSRWIVTAKACFSDGTTPVTAGAPARPTTVLIGRADSTTTTTGHRLEVVSLVPHPDRDIVLAELSSPVHDIAPIALGAAPQAGETLHVAGYGRTGTEWVPARMHAGDFTVGSVNAAAFDVQGATSNATLCKGDGGGPAFRDGASGPQLVGINDTAEQHGCLGEAAGTSTGSEARIDDLGDWIRTSVAVTPDGLLEPVTGEFTRDGIQDMIAADAAGLLWLYPGTPAPGVWAHRVLIGSGWTNYRDLAVGRINRDAYDDLIAVRSSTGDLYEFPGTAAGTRFADKIKIQAGWGTGLRDVTVGKVDRDDYDDILAVKDSTRQLLLFKGTAAGDGFAAGVQDGTGWTCCDQLTLGKFNNDDYPDLLTVDTGGALRMYPGTAEGTSWPTQVDTQSGTGWGAYSYLVGGRFDGSGLDSLLTVDAATGVTTVHPRTATGGWGTAVRTAGTPYTPQPYDMTKIVTGEFTRDAYRDLIGTDDAGRLWLFPGTPAHTFGPRIQVGEGWNGYRDLIVGRVDRDQYDDLVAIQTSTGKMYSWAGTAAGTTWGTKTQINSGWSTDLRDLTMGKVDRDDYDDIETVQNSTNKLLLYRGTAAGNGLLAGVVNGSGWNCCSQPTLGEFNGDGYDDLIAIDTGTGALRLYPGTAAGTVWGAGADTPSGTDWAARTELTAFSLTPGAHAGVLVKDSTGKMLWYPSGTGGSVDWTDPIAFGPRD